MFSREFLLLTGSTFVGTSIGAYLYHTNSGHPRPDVQIVDDKLSLKIGQVEVKGMAENNELRRRFRQIETDLNEVKLELYKVKQEVSVLKKEVADLKVAASKAKR